MHLPNWECVVASNYKIFLIVIAISCFSKEPSQSRVNNVLAAASGVTATTGLTSKVESPW